jgi:lipopolysaccharide export system protein LptC
MKRAGKGFGVAGIAQGAGARERVAVARDPRARAYAQARRHSARVRFYKRVIPLGIAAGVALVLLFAFVGPAERLAGLSLGPISFSGTKITMESPRLTGFHKDSRAYEVTATSATQDVRKPHIVELNVMKARLVVDDQGTAAHLEAATGVFDTQREHLELRQEVRVTTDSGQEARLKSASIDFKAGTVVSREPVTVKLTNGTVEADGLEIGDNGKVITFAGRVRTVFEGTSSEIPPVPQAVATSSSEGRVQPAHAVVPQSQPMSLRP